MTPSHFHLSYPALADYIYIRQFPLFQPFLSRLSQFIDTIQLQHHKCSLPSSSFLLLHHCYLPYSSDRFTAFINSPILSSQYHHHLPSQVASGKMAPQQKPDDVVRSSLTPWSSELVCSLGLSVFEIPAVRPRRSILAHHGREMERSLD